MRSVLLAVLLVMYVSVALMNYSVTQSLLGAAAGGYLSKETGGVVKIGSLHASPFSHLVLHDVLLITPEGDTVCNGERIACNFKHFPFKDNALRLSKVKLTNVYYHFAHQPGGGNNLNFLIDYFHSDKVKEKTSKGPFVVEVGELLLNGVHYKQDLKDRPRHFPNGVYIQHMEYDNIVGKIKNIRVEGDDVTCRFVKFHAEEKSGFVLQDMSMDVHVSSHEIVAKNMELQLDSSRLMMDAALEYANWKTMKHYCDSVMMRATFRPGTEVAMSDVAYWAPVLWGHPSHVTLTGSVTGPVADMRAKDLKITLGESTAVDLDGTIKGLPKAGNMVLDVDVRHLTSCSADIDELMRGFHVRQGAALQSIIQNLGAVDLSASFEGGANNCQAVVGGLCDMGDFDATASIHYDEAIGDYRYTAEVGSGGLGLGKLVPNEWVTRSGFALNASGAGLDPATMRASLEGRLFNTYFRGTPLQQATLDAEILNQVLTAELAVADTLADLDLVASMNWHDSVPQYAADLSARRLMLGELHLADSLSASALVHADLSGRKLDEMTGQVSVENLQLQRGEEHLDMDNATLQVGQHRGRKTLQLNSDWLKMTARGYFDYADIGLVGRQLVQYYLPQYYQKREDALAVYDSLADVTMNIDLTLTHPKPLAAFVAPQLLVADQTSVHVNYNYAESAKLVVRSDSLGFGTVALYDIGINGAARGSSYALEVDAENLALSHGTVAEELRCRTLLNREQSQVGLQWGDSQDGMFYGDLVFDLQSDSVGNYVTVSRPNLTYAGTDWRLTTTNPIYFAQDTLLAHTLRFSTDERYIAIEACKGPQIADSATAVIRQMDLGHITDIFLSDKGFQMQGLVNGHCSVAGFEETPHMNAQLTIDGCEVNQQPLGDVTLLSNWNAELKRINLDLQSLLPREAGPMHPITATGYVSLEEPKTTLDFLVDIGQLDLAMAAPLVSSFSSRIEGLLQGEITVRGAADDPEINGELKIEDGALLVDATGVCYRLSDSVHLTENQLQLRKVIVTDPQGNFAMLKGNLSYKQPMTLDCHLNSPNLMVLDNRTTGTSYYGTLFAAVDATVQGPLDNLAINAQVRTNPGSEITVPISDKKSVKNQGYITFVGSGDEDDGDYDRQRGRGKNAIQIALQAAVTPDLKLNLPMDFQQMYVKVGASGSGDLQLAMDQSFEPVVTGNYEILNGTLNLNLLGLLTRNFTIDEGSAINFSGDLADAQFDIKAAYAQRVNLSTLTGVASTSENSQQNVLVEDVIALSGQISNPTVGFDIRLPNVDQSVEEEVFAYIDRTNERDMLTQSVSLLLLGKFNSAASATTDIADNNLINGYSVVASTVGSLVSDMVQFVDLNIDYKAATSLTQEQLDVDISKEWNKFYFESTLGYGVEAQDLDGNGSNYNLVGDMLVGYKLSPMVHLFVFNRSNTNDYTRADLPYKQGLGLKLTKDFNGWRDLWKKSNKKN